MIKGKLFIFLITFVSASARAAAPNTAGPRQKSVTEPPAKPAFTRPNPDAVTKPDPASFGSPEGTTASGVVATVKRQSANAGDRPLVGEPVALDDTLKLLNRLKDYKGKITGAKPDKIQRELGLLLSGEAGYRVDAFGCDKINPLIENDDRTQTMECTLKYARVTKEMDTAIEINFATDSWAVETARLKDVDYHAGLE